MLSTKASAFIAELNADYDRVRDQHANKKQTPLLTLEKARANSAKIDWKDYLVKPPKYIGRRVFKNFNLAELEQYIDWGPFFQTWDLAGPYPAILKDEIVGAEAVRLMSDARRMLTRLIDGRWLSAQAVVGLYPANSIGDDIVLWRDESRSERLLTWTGLRQQTLKPEGRPNRCLSDFVGQEGVLDYVGMFSVTAGIGVESREKFFMDDHDDYSAIMFKALADRLAEAMAECMHARVRVDLWGYSEKEQLSPQDLIAEKYVGIRPAPGYPACPDHSVKKQMFEVLQCEDIGMSLTESLAMYPAASVCGFYIAHPQAKYFNVGRIGSDQVSDLAKRQGIQEADLKRMLAPNL